MDSDQVMLLIVYLVIGAFVLAIGLTYWSLRRRDRRMRERGATEDQIYARSHAEIGNSKGAWAVFIGLMLSFFGAWSAIEAHLNSDRIPWGHSLLLLTLGAGLIGLGGWRIIEAAKLKRFSEEGLDKERDISSLSS